MKKLYKRAGAILTALAILLGLFPARMAAADSETAPTASVTFTFADSGVTASDSDYDGWISGTALTISSAGTYAVTGSCSEGNVTVAKGLTGVVLVLSDLTLSCSTSAPLLCKKSTGVTLWLDGDSTLTDKEDASTEDTNSDFEGAAVKVNSEGASLLIKGTGSLTADGSACKNGIKAGSASTITVSGGTLNITAANNGLAADGAVIIKGGTLNVTATNDGIKASPDDDDTTSAGTITIYDGDITIDAQSDGINAAGDITIYGGTFKITAQSDGIQTDSNLTISDGTFDITTMSGYNSSGFNSDTMSCKGLKVSASDDDTADATNTITITGGSFTLNTADDAIHSDAYIEITGGKFTIQTGDDGAHADTSLILGTSGGTIARDPDMTINNSYEGLEAGTVYIYSGRYYVIASDDGINAAGGSSSGSDPGAGGGNNFNPGGGGPGGRLMGGFNGARLLATSDYSLNIMGGSVYVNADGDGLDSNGALTLTGGNIEVWGQYNRDNEPLDYDGTLTVNGATVFAAGSAGMGMASPSGGSQSYQNFSNSYSSGTVIVVTNGSSTVYNAKAPKNVNYVFFSAPNVSSPALSTGSGVNCQYGNDWTHTWNSGAVTTEATTGAAGVRTYTCSVCGETATETIPQLVSIPEDADDSSDTDTGYVVTFVTDGNCSINLYYTQDYTTPDETNVTSAVSRTKAGVVTSDGGQVNFAVVPNSGYAVASVTGTPDTNYNNLKGADETGVENVYRMTKITGAVTVTATAQATESETVTVSGIAVKTAPTKTAYTVGDSFDPAGLVLTVTYSDTSTADVAYSSDAGITFSGFDNSTAGTQTVTATYAGYSATFTVTVAARETVTVSGIAVKTKPAKTAYTVGDSFDPAGLVLTVTYSDTSTADVAYSSGTGIAFAGFDSSTEGDQTITVSYQGQSATFTVTVAARESETVSIAIPVANTGLRYTGREQIGVPSGTGYTLGGTYAAANVGDYAATATLNAGYVWADGSSDVKTISWSIARANGPAAPTGLSGVAPTTENGVDGQITGTSSDMEYSLSSAFDSASDCADNATTGLSAGTYYVRYKQTNVTEAGAAATVTVPAYSGGGSSGGGSGSPGGGSSGTGSGSSSGGGCYVATAVYGSYDCPQVWTLRRFRDNVLAETWYGRLFIRAYYAVSPAAVRLFGDAEWFQNFWREKLDGLVAGLQADGFESTPYEDTVW